MLTLERGNLSLAVKCSFPVRLIHPNVTVRRSMAGTLRTNIKRNAKVQWQFEIYCNDEVFSFLDSVIGSVVKMTYETDVRLVRILSEPTEIVDATRRTSTLLVEEV